MGVTHQGIAADASELNNELEQFVEELKEAHPNNAFRWNIVEIA